MQGLVWFTQGAMGVNDEAIPGYIIQIRQDFILCFLLFLLFCLCVPFYVVVKLLLYLQS